MKKSKQSNILTILAALAMFLTGIVGAGSARAEMSDYPIVKLQSLDKSTARTMTFEARVGSTIKFGPLYIKTSACRKSSPLDSPESSAFMQVWEVTKKEEAHWIFSGWMFASSPALSAMDHPIYDVWVLDCLEKKNAKGESEEGVVTPDEKPEQAEAEAEAKPTVDPEAEKVEALSGD